MEQILDEHAARIREGEQRYAQLSLALDQVGRVESDRMGQGRAGQGRVGQDCTQMVGR